MSHVTTYKSDKCSTRSFLPLGAGALALAGLGFANQVERTAEMSEGPGVGQDLRSGMTPLAHIHCKRRGIRGDFKGREGTYQTVETANVRVGEKLGCDLAVRVGHEFLFATAKSYVPRS